MTLSGLAFAYARRRPLATALVVALAALGVGIATLTLLVTHELEGRLLATPRESTSSWAPREVRSSSCSRACTTPTSRPGTSRSPPAARESEGRERDPARGRRQPDGFRIVGTEPALVEHYGATLASGSMFGAPMEAVLGSEVARATGLRVGARSPDRTDSPGVAPSMRTPYRVVGMLAPTGRVVDRLVLTPVESVWDVQSRRTTATPGRRGSDAETTRTVEGGEEGEENRGREVTMILVRYRSPVAATSLAREINARARWSAASPAYETARLFTVFGVGVDLVRAFAAILVAASALLLFVALAQALEERRYDLAIMRALGARRRDIVWVLRRRAWRSPRPGCRRAGHRAARRRRSAPGCRPPANPLGARRGTSSPGRGVVAGWHSPAVYWPRLAGVARVPSGCRRHTGRRVNP